MKKLVGIVLLVIVALLTGCGSKAMEDLQTNYDRLSSQYDSLQLEYDRLREDYNDLKSERDELIAIKDYSSDFKILLPTGKLSTYDNEKKKLELLTQICMDNDKEREEGYGLQPDGSAKIKLDGIDEDQKLLDEYWALWDKEFTMK